MQQEQAVSGVDECKDGRERSWFALSTAMNNEKKVEQHLQIRSIETFLPLYSVKRRWKNRTEVTVETPLFAGYVFVRIARAQRFKVLEVPMVYSLVGNGREALPLPDAEIEALRAAVSPGQVDPYPYLKVGERAKIQAGPFAGLEGIVLRKTGNLRVVINIDLLMKSVAVHVNAEELAPCQ